MNKGYIYVPYISANIVSIVDKNFQPNKLSSRYYTTSIFNIRQERRSKKIRKIINLLS